MTDTFQDSPMQERLEVLEKMHPGADLHVEELFGEGGEVVEQFIHDANTGKDLACETRKELMIPIRRERTNFEEAWNV